MEISDWVNKVSSDLYIFYTNDKPLLNNHIFLYNILMGELDTLAVSSY